MKRILFICLVALPGCTFVERSAVFIGSTTRDVVDGAVNAWDAGVNAFSAGGSDEHETSKLERPVHPGAIDDPAPSAIGQEDKDDESQAPATPRLPEVRGDQYY